MGALKRYFRLESNDEWRAAFIEVKSTSRPEKFFFHLSDRQFERVEIKGNTADYQAQTLHGTDELYLIVNVQNALSRPAISGVLDDPIRFLNDRRVLFRTEGGVIGRWGRRVER